MILRILSIAKLVLLKMRRDKRSIGLVVVAPLLIMTLITFIFNEKPGTLQRVAPAIISVFTFLFTFLLTGITFIRERASGTLERILLTNLKVHELLIGYFLGFFIFALIQATIVTTFVLFMIDYSIDSTLINLIIIIFLSVLCSVNAGIMFSSLAQNEFQMVQFIPVFFAPQIFLAGIFVPVDDMPRLLEIISKFLPISYAFNSTKLTIINKVSIEEIIFDLIILFIFSVIFIIASSLVVNSQKNNK